jgi:hypothetical protein
MLLTVGVCVWMLFTMSFCTYQLCEHVRYVLCMLCQLLGVEVVTLYHCMMILMFMCTLQCMLLSVFS